MAQGKVFGHSASSPIEFQDTIFMDKDPVQEEQEEQEERCQN